MTSLSPGQARFSVFGIVALGLVVAACSSSGGDLFGSPADAGEGGEGNEPNGGANPSGGAPASQGGAPASQGGAPASQGGAQPNGGTAQGGSTAKGGSAPGAGGSQSSGAAGMPQTPSGGAGGGCTWMGKTYPPGVVPSSDCNTCRCIEGGHLVCTAIACAAGGAPGFDSCEQVRDALGDELERIQRCDSDEQCGQVLKGTSCGCTRDWVARLDADPSHLQELLATQVDGDLCNSGGSTCDCPAADGFACIDERCSWNYQSQGPSCESTPPGRICLRGIPIGSGERLEAGAKLGLLAAPADGCRSSSCTRVDVASCSLESSGGQELVASANFCLADLSSSGGACTDDCAGGGFAMCESDVTLTEGEYTLRFGDRTLTFQVPSVVAPGDDCIELGQ
jgi:hypothetical protein